MSSNKKETKIKKNVKEEIQVIRVNLKLFKIYSTLGPLFSDVDTSIQIKQAEKLGSIKIPDVGDLKRIKDLTKLKDNRALELLEHFRID